MCDSDEFDGGSELVRVSLSLKVFGFRLSLVRIQPHLFFGHQMQRSRTRACGCTLTLASTQCARQRQTSADEPLTAHDTQDMKTNVTRWREKQEPFMTKDPTARHAARVKGRSHILVE